MSHFCSTCNVMLKSNKTLQVHLKSKRHVDKTQPDTQPNFVCSRCRKTYATRQSMHVHMKSCIAVAETTLITAETFEDLKNTVLEDRRKHQLEREEYLKERDELRSQIAALLDKQLQITSNTNTNSHNNNTVKTNNVTNININAFGNENTDYIDEKVILSCIDRVYKSIPSLLAKIHFDPKHPENHNIKITNKKLPYASVMGNNKKWKTVDRKDAIDTMVQNGFNMLDDTYVDNKEKFTPSKQQNFEGFLSKFESEDKDVIRQIKTEVDMMVINESGA